MERKLVPYSIYVPEEIYKKIKQLAKGRKASEIIREGIVMRINGLDTYNSGYNKGLQDAAKVVYECEEAQMIAVKGKDLGAILAEKIDTLEIKK